MLHPPVDSTEVQALLLGDYGVVGLIEKLFVGEEGLVELVVLGSGETAVSGGGLFRIEHCYYRKGFFELESVADNVFLHFIAPIELYTSPTIP